MMKRLFIACILLLIVTNTALIAQQRPDAPEYAQKGVYSVGVIDRVIDEDAERPLQVSIWYPALNPDGIDGDASYGLANFPMPLTNGRAIRDADYNLDAGSYPLVVFSHGSGGMRFQSLFLTEHLASYGFVVIATDHPTNTVLDQLRDPNFSDNLGVNYVDRPDDISRLIAYAETELSDLVDIGRIAVMGHSFGGYTAFAATDVGLNFDQLTTQCESGPDSPVAGVCFLLYDWQDMVDAAGLDAVPVGAWPITVDERIKARVAFAPWNGPILDAQNLAETRIPTLIMVGSQDDVTPPNRDSFLIYNNLTQAPKILAILQNAGHYVFVDECFDLAIEFGQFASCSDEVWDMARVHDLINHLTTAFLLSTLYEDTDALGAIQADGVDFKGVDYYVQNFGPEPVFYVPQIVSIRPHDATAFTQGLLLHDGTFYESTGGDYRYGYGNSTLRQVEPETGEIIRSVDVSDEFFAEGLALVDDRLIQLTWQTKVAFVYDLETFEQIATFEYEGEGWGLCYDGTDLYMSDGTGVIERRNPDTFEVVGQIFSTIQGEPVSRIEVQGHSLGRLNELECVGDSIYANVYQTDFILEIDKHTGYVLGVIDTRGALLAAQEVEQLTSSSVLNGIAYDAENDVFYITGKLWPKLFEVTFVAR